MDLIKWIWLNHVIKPVIKSSPFLIKSIFSSFTLGTRLKLDRQLFSPILSHRLRLFGLPFIVFMKGETFMANDSFLCRNVKPGSACNRGTNKDPPHVGVLHPLPLGGEILVTRLPPSFTADLQTTKWNCFIFAQIASVGFLCFNFAFINGWTAAGPRGGQFCSRHHPPGKCEGHLQGVWSVQGCVSLICRPTGFMTSSTGKRLNTLLRKK